MGQKIENGVPLFGQKNYKSRAEGARFRKFSPLSNLPKRPLKCLQTLSKNVGEGDEKNDIHNKSDIASS